MAEVPGAKPSPRGQTQEQFSGLRGEGRVRGEVATRLLLITLSLKGEGVFETAPK